MIENAFIGDFTERGETPFQKNKRMSEVKNDYHTADFVLCPIHTDGKNRGGKQRTERLVFLPEASPGEGLCAWPYRAGNGCKEEKKIYDCLFCGHGSSPDPDYPCLERGT